MISAVVFDLGDVLASGEGITSEPARLLGVDEDAFRELYWAGRAAYDAGSSDRAYWEPILTALGKPAALETVQQLAQLDARLWLRLRPEARQLVSDVRRTGRPVAVLSNAPFNLDHALVDAEFADEVDYWFISAAMGLSKPNLGVYLRVAEVLDVPPGEIAFIDDKAENLAGAQRAGWTTHLWSSDADSRAWLEEVGVLDA
ncbi:MAG: HAD-IA family hydrolase [Propionibacteriaceae bacterium]|nr:HAD-IA family hydrolase [Propionibacteriaceae bacterium]